MKREPHLTYRKGEGWIYVSSGMEVTYDHVRYYVTIERRPPLDHERGWDITQVIKVWKGNAKHETLSDEEILEDIVKSYPRSVAGVTAFGWIGYHKPKDKREVPGTHVTVFTEIL